MGKPVTVEDLRCPHGLHEALFNAKFQKHMKFALMFETSIRWCGTDETDMIENLMPFWMENYFKRENYLVIDDRRADVSETYAVQSVRLGYRSELSNPIYVAASASVGEIVSDASLRLVNVPGGVKVVCNEGDVKLSICDLSGQMIFYQRVNNGRMISLNPGAYIVRSDGFKSPMKIIVR